jgi:hypothetical protein
MLAHTLRAQCSFSREGTSRASRNATAIKINVGFSQAPDWNQAKGILGFDVDQGVDLCWPFHKK